MIKELRDFKEEVFKELDGTLSKQYTEDEIYSIVMAYYKSLFESMESLDNLRIHCENLFTFKCSLKQVTKYYNKTRSSLEYKERLLASIAPIEDKSLELEILNLKGIVEKLEKLVVRQTNYERNKSRIKNINSRSYNTEGDFELDKSPKIYEDS